MTRTVRHPHFGRVENGRGSLGHAATLRLGAQGEAPNVGRTKDWGCSQYGQSLFDPICPKFSVDNSTRPRNGMPLPRLLCREVPS